MNALYNKPIVSKHIIVIDLGLYRKSMVTSSTFCSSKFSCSSELGQEQEEYVLDRVYGNSAAIFEHAKKRRA